jgi:hypothetical protein
MMPQLIRISVRRRQRRAFRLWVPLLPLLLVLSPVLVMVLVVGTVACAAYRINPVRALVAGWRLVCGLPGTRIDIDHPDAAVVVAIN